MAMARRRCHASPAAGPSLLRRLLLRPLLALALLTAGQASAKYVPSTASADWVPYSPAAEWPSAVAGPPLPKLYMEPKLAAPYARLRKNVSAAHCDFLEASGIRWIVWLGDSVSRSAGVAMMEHLAGDDTHFCDPADAPEEVHGTTKYLNDKKFAKYRRQTCPAGFEAFSVGLNPEVNSPLDARVCGGRVRVTAVEIWEYEHVKTRLIPFVRGESLVSFNSSVGRPDLVVSSIFRSVRYVTRYHKYPGLVAWFKSLFAAVKGEGIRHIYMGMHARNMARVPHIFHKTQNNTHTRLANQAAWEAAKATNTSMVDMYNVTLNKELFRDTLDGTHIGWRGNSVKVDRVLRAIVHADFRARRR